MAKSHLMVMDDNGVWVPLRQSLLVRIARNTGSAAKPENEVTPVVSGAPPMVGTVLSVSNGIWYSVEDITGYAYQWKRDGSNISGATGKTYTLAAADVGKSVSCAVTATNTTGSTAADSNAIGPIGSAPVNTVAPAITGTATEGETLTASDGTWQGYPVPTLTYQWFRSSEAIVGATDATYELTTDDVGETITVTVTAMNLFGTASETSAATAEVEPAEEEEGVEE